MQDNECRAHLQTEKKVNGIVIVELEAQVLKKEEVTFQTCLTSLLSVSVTLMYT